MSLPRFLKKIFRRKIIWRPKRSSSIQLETDDNSPAGLLSFASLPNRLILLAPIRLDPDYGLATEAAAEGGPVTANRHGTVIEYDVNSRCGTVSCFDTNGTFLARHSELEPPLTALRVGQVVEFQVITGPENIPTARSVRLIIDTPEAAQPRSEGGQNEATTGGPHHDPATAASSHDPTTAAVTEEMKCSICLDLLATDSVQTPCEHYFCRECISRWLEAQSECPTCKYEAVPSQLAPVPRVVKNLIALVRPADGK